MLYENGIWVFGYGSLIWNPGFEFAAKQRATLTGFNRAFCLWSIHYRGNEKHPGLVLGLDPEQGAQCEGVAYFVEAKAAEDVHLYLRKRELVSYAYHERLETLRLEDGQKVQAICYVVDPDHSQYAGGLSLTAQAQVIQSAKGSAGENLEYLCNTAAHLEALGIEDDDVQALLQLTLPQKF
jgi:cation transport protein ChaC